MQPCQYSTWQETKYTLYKHVYKFTQYDIVDYINLWNGGQGGYSGIKSNLSSKSATNLIPQIRYCSEVAMEDENSFIFVEVFEQNRCFLHHGIVPAVLLQRRFLYSYENIFSFSNVGLRSTGGSGIKINPVKNMNSHVSSSWMHTLNSLSSPWHHVSMNSPWIHLNLLWFYNVN